MASTVAALGRRWSACVGLAPAAADPRRPARATASTRCVAEAADETAEAKERLAAVAGTDADAAAPASRAGRPDRPARRRRAASSVVLAGPVGDAARIAAGGTDVHARASTLASVPAAAARSHFAELGRPSAWTYTDDPARPTPTATTVSGEPGIVVGSQVPLPADGGTYTLYFLFPLDEEQETHRAGHPGAAHRRRCCCCVLVAGHDLAGHPAGRHPGPAGPPGRRAARRRPARRSGCGSRGEDDLARLATSFNQMATSLQRQIRQLEELCRVQRRFVSDVSHELRTPLTTVRMAGDVLHDARDELRPGHRPRRRAAADRARPVRDAARRPARDQPLRRRRRGARARRRQPRRRRPPGRRHDPRAGRAARRPGRRAGARPTRAWPRPTYAGSSGSCATWSPTRSTTPTSPVGIVVARGRRRPRGRDRGARPRRRAGARASPRWSSTGSGAPTRPGPAPAAAPASGCRSRWRTPTCTAAGCRPGAGPGEGAQFRLTLPRRAGGVLRQSPLPLVPDGRRGAGRA